MKISVIIPIYNAQNYLNQCLTSVLNQTIKNFEVICVDDGSTDASADIVKSFMKDDDRIRFFQQPNLGSGTARNLGLDQSTGEFVCFMDADDYYPSAEVLERLYESAKKNSVEIAGGSFAYFSESQDGLNQDFGESFEGYIFQNNEVINYRDYQFDYGYHRFIYSLGLIRKNNLKFPNYLRFQDPVFFTQCMVTAERFAANKFITYAYRTAGKQLQWNKAKVLGLLDGLQDNFSLSRANGLSKLTELTKTRLIQHIASIKQIKSIDVLKKLNGLVEYAEEDLKNFLKDHKLYYTKENYDSPEISVILYIYNSENNLIDCLLSIFSQTFENFEVICLNDGSTDGSLKILTELSKLDSRLKVINKDNTGYKDIINIGINSSRGKYISFIEPNDFVSKKFLETLYNEISYFNSDFVKADFFLYWSQDSKKQYCHCIDDYSKYGVTVTDFTEPELTTSVTSNWTGLYSLNFLKKFNIKLNNSLPSFLGKSFYYQIIFFASSARYIKEALYFSRQDTKNTNINHFHKANASINEYKNLEKIISSINTDKFNAVLIKNKYVNLISALAKLNEKEKNPFLLKIAAEIQNDLNKHRIKRNFFDFYLWNIIKTTIKEQKLSISTDSYNNNVVIACFLDINKVKKFKTFVHSIKYNRDFTTKIDFYVIHDNIAANNIKSIINSLKDKFITINFISLTRNEYLKKYLKLYLPFLLPSKINKVIYFDLETIVNCDLTDLFQINIEKYYVAGCRENLSLKNKNTIRHKINELISFQYYIDSAILLINLKKIRSEMLLEKLHTTINENNKFSDQDLINLYYKNKIFILPLRYNFMTKYHNDIINKVQNLESSYSNNEMISAINNPFIINYKADEEKPWNKVSSPLAFYWWYHAILSKSHTIFSLLPKTNSINPLEIVRQIRPILKYSNPELKDVYLFLKKLYRLFKSIVR